MALTKRAQTAAAQRPRSAASAGEVTGGAWLARDVLLLVGWLESADAGPGTVELERGDGTTVAVDVLPIPARSEHRSDAAALLVRFPAAVDPGLPVGRLRRRAKRRRGPFGPDDLRAVVTDFKTLLRDAFAWLDPKTRAGVLEFLVAATAGWSDDEAQLSDSLHRAREALRERLPRSVVGADQPHIIHVEMVVALDQHAMYVEGWLHSEAAGSRLIAVSPEGERVELTDRYFRYPRRDVAEFLSLPDEPRKPARPGFVCYFELGAASRRPDGWIFELHPPEGEAASEAHASSSVKDDAVAARDMVLRDLDHERLPRHELRERHVMPAITRLQRRLQAEVGVAEIQQYGAPPEAPELSVVVPLYRRMDFLEHQMAQFVHDPEVREADLLYVLDSPDDADELTNLATQLHRLYDVPFRVVVLDRNAGFSTVNNIGASFARGRLLLLLNSDVLPDAPGWLAELRDFYDATPAIGALSPKLLYEDGSIQHAGLYFDRPTGANIWSNEHLYKGLAGSLPAANVARPVPAVTAACLMISRELYEQMDGLRGMYVRGDYEDSDLCLRLYEAGLECWYAPHVQLYHLEGQSYSDEARGVASQYNAWVHSSLWNDQMETLMASTESMHAGAIQ